MQKEDSTASTSTHFQFSGDIAEIEINLQSLFRYRTCCDKVSTNIILILIEKDNNSLTFSERCLISFALALFRISLRVGVARLIGKDRLMVRVLIFLLTQDRELEYENLFQLCDILRYS